MAFYCLSILLCSQMWYQAGFTEPAFEYSLSKQSLQKIILMALLLAGCRTLAKWQRLL